MDAGLAESFQSQANGLVPQFRGALTARIALPKVATAPFRLEDTASAAAISVALQGAHDVPATVADGYVLFERAHASGATVLHRALPEGTEDVLSFDSRPSTSEVSYVVTLDASVRGLRLVENTLEMLDANGAPRLRVAPPYVLGADHAVTHASLIVRGCAFDTNPAPPWGRVVTPPGASSCTVSIRWDDSRVTYPALLDPRWTSTQSMSGPRQGHTATLLSTGKLLVAGGSNGSSELASAELYDRLTNTWATTGSMTGVRRLHSAVQLGTTSSSTTSGKVFVVGGIQGSTSRTSSELYSVSAGTWVLGANMSSGRHQHTATLLSNGQVLIAGGMTGTSVLDTAALYNPASGTGTWTATSNMASARRAHTAVLLSVPGNATLNNKVLVVGGNSGTGSLSSVQLFSGTSWSTLTALPTPREGHTMTTLANGNVLVTGGTNGSTVLSTALVFNAATGSGSWSTTGAMTSVRQAHTATLLPSGSAGTAQVVVAGGSNGTLSLDTAETWNGTVWSASTSLPAKVQGHTATLLPNNTVLVAGGVNGTTTTSTTALFDASFANACTINAQCASGFCVSGVCCDTACNGGCGSCNLPGKVGICSPQAAGTVCRSAPAGSCDASELCSGTGLACPADVNAPDGTPCNDGLTCTIGESCQAGACKPSAPATCTSGSSVTFYQSYDNGTTVDVAGGPKTPRGANAIIPAPGLFGPGIDGNTATEISYVDPTGTNISLAKPGSVSYWMKTQDGHIPLEFEVFDGFPRTNLYAVDRGSSGIGADVYFLNGASTGPSILQSGLSGFPVSGWANDGRWHLVVINWTPTKLGVSLDGGPLALTDVGWMQSDHVFASSVGSLLYVGGTNTGPGGYLGAGDELIVLNRAMSTPEIQWYWAQRTAGGPAVKNPAPAYFNAVPAACNQWDDLNPCTTDACTQAGGVTHSVVPNATACSDGDACNGAETCQAGACTAGPPPTASDECPTNGCNPTDPNCIMPKFEGIIAGTPARAVFSYRNLSGQNVNIPYGTNNGLSDGTGFIAAPSVFPPVWLLAGQQRNVFITPITGTLTWNIYGSSATATVTGTPIPVTSTAQGPQGALSDGTPFQMDFDPSYGIVATDTASAGVTVGKTSGGSFAVTADGAASYKLPLWVPPGRGGFQPNLALEYNSRHGSGHLGVGWALAGMSELSRCDKTVAVDAVAAEPAFAAGDALCLDGRRLVPVSGSGGDGTVYWEAETSFNQIIQHGDLSHPTTFEVRHPDGSVALYDKAVVPNASPAPERAWLLGSVRDKASNVLKYHYLEVNGIFAREYAVDRIDYVFSDTAETVPTRSVVFNYELNAKLDDKMVWQQEQMISRRIKSIDLLGPNPTTTSSLRSYKLAYDVGALSGRDRLVSVTECVHDSADVCKRPTTFKYSDDTSPKYQLYTSAYCETTWPLSGYSGYGTTSSHSREKVVDINGDGLDDVLDVFYDYSIDIFFQTPDGSGSSQGKAGGRFATRLSDGTKLGPEIDLSSQLPGIGDMEYYPVDIDGDGLTDIIAPDQANGNVDTLTPYYLYHNDSVRGAATPQVANGACKTTSTNIHFTKSAQPILQIQPDPTPSVERPYFRSRPYLADTDGDGLLDLLQGYGVATPGQQAWAGYQWEWSHGLPGGSFAAPSNVVFQTSGYLTGPYGFLHETILGTKLHQRAGRSWLIPTSTRNISIAGATVFRNVFQAFDVDGSGHTSAFDPLLHDDQVPASVAVDMNGDGLPEMVKVAAYPESCDAQGHTCPQVPESIFFAQNVDGHFTSDKVTSQMTRWTSSGMNAFSIDYNQDGWQDLVLLFENRQAGQESWGTYPGSVHPGVYVSSRTDFQAPVGPTTSSGTAVPSLYLENGTRLRATAGVGTAPEGPNSLRELHYATPFDVNGDGLSDLLLGPDVYVRQGGKVDLLTGVVDGEAHDTVVSYRPLGDRGPMYPNSSQPFYAHGTDVSYPLASEDKGIWAVASVAVDSGQSVRSADPSLCASCGVTADSSYNWFYYGYEGARTNLRTEEWLGFTKRIVYDAAHGRTTTTTYDTSQTVFGAYNLGKFHPITEETLLSVPAHDTGLYVNQALNYRRHVDYHYRTHFPAASAGANVFLLLPYQIIEDESDTGSSILPTRHVTTTFGYDNYGNVTSKTEDHTGVESLRQTTTYDNRTTGNTWLLGLPQLVTETSTPVNGDPPVTRETDHTYDARGFLWTETIEPHGDVSVRRVRSLERNLYGSIRKVTETDGTGQSRLTETTYDAAGMFPATTINALGQVTKTTYHPGYGFLVFVTDPNEATSKTRYDRFGRQKLTETADRQQLSSSYLASARTNTAYAVSQVATDGRATQSHFSRLDLETARYTLLPDGSNGVVQKSYDRFGQVAQQLSPAVVNASFVSTTTNSYDARDRLIRVVTSGLASEGSTQKTVFYAGNTVATVEPVVGTDLGALYPTHVVDHDELGRPTTATDYKDLSRTSGVATSFSYGAFGTLRSVQSAGVTTTHVYDVRGRETSKVDASSGTTGYTYDAWNNVTSITDANLNTTARYFDAMNRLKSEDTYLGTDSYDWDSAPFGIGKPAGGTSASGVGGTHSATAYDWAGHLVVTARATPS